MSKEVHRLKERGERGAQVRVKNLFLREEMLRNSLALPTNSVKCSPLQSESHPSAIQQAVGQCTLMPFRPH